MESSDKVKVMFRVSPEDYKVLGAECLEELAKRAMRIIRNEGFKERYLVTHVEVGVGKHVIGKHRVACCLVPGDPNSSDPERLDPLPRDEQLKMTPEQLRVAYEKDLMFLHIARVREAEEDEDTSQVPT